MLHAVAGAEAAESAGVVDVYFAGVAGHCFCDFEDVGAAGVEVVEPEPEVCGEFRVVLEEGWLLVMLDNFEVHVKSEEDESKR